MKSQYTTNVYEQRIDIVPSRMYWDQCSNSKNRGHEKPDYSKQELYDWVVSQPHYENLYNEWKIAGFPSNLRPSCDRLDNSEGYSFSNIELVTWEENQRRAREDVKEGKLGGTHKKVYQYTLKGEYVKEFISCSEAGRSGDGFSQANISSACRGIITYAYGYQWRYEKKTKLEPLDVIDYSQPIAQYDARTGILLNIYPGLNGTSFSEEKKMDIREVVRGVNLTVNGEHWAFEFLTPEKVQKICKKAIFQKRVNQYSVDGELLREFSSPAEASRVTGVPLKGISATCLGAQSKCKGFVWKYV